MFNISINLSENVNPDNLMENIDNNKVNFKFLSFDSGVEFESLMGWELERVYGIEQSSL